MALGVGNMLGGAGLLGYGIYKGRKGMKNNDVYEANAGIRQGASGIGMGIRGAKITALGAGLYAGDELYNYYKDKPRNVIAKAIASK
jgi:hypothetical protein